MKRFWTISAKPMPATRFFRLQAAETAINMVRDGIGIGIYDGNAGGRACEISG